MSQTTHHYSGLTSLEVIENRKKYGVNILTPPEKITFWQKLKTVLKHYISISTGILTIISLIAAFCLLTSMGQMIFVMPAVVLLSWF